MDEINSFDLHAAWVRRAQTDLKAFLEALAARLEGALPGRVEIERKRDSLLSSHHHVVGLVIKTDNGRYLLDAKTPDIRTSRQHEVRGVVVRTDTLPLAEWISTLESDLKRMSGNLAGASGVLHDFLAS